MKRFAYFTYLISCLLILLSCSEGKVAKMRQGLDSINMVNRSGKPFTVSDVEPYVQFFDKHGEPNDRLLAYYLLGRAYYDHGEAPMALQCYYDAIEKADTTDKDCDYAQLSRVYGQMSDIFYDQLMPEEQLQQIDNAVKYALYTKDTLSSLIYFSQKANAYEWLDMPDSIVAVCERVATSLRKIGRNDYAATVMSLSIRPLLESHDTAKVRQIIALYDTETSLFDKDGNIETGREIYYNQKGYYYLLKGQTDSAEYYFRKELATGKDFNNQNAGSKGMADLFTLKNQPDSAAKYYQHSYAMNDSMHAEIRAEDIERIQSMYNYSRYQKEARMESDKANRREKIIWLGIGLLVILCFSIYIIISRQIYQRNEMEQKYMHSLSIISQAQNDILQLKTHIEENHNLIAEKEKIILEQNNIQKQCLQKSGNNKKLIDRLFKSSPIYKQFESMSIKGFTPTEEQWEELVKTIYGLYPTFHELMEQHRHSLNEKEFKTCILVKADFKPNMISNMLGVHPSYITNIRSKMLYSLFGDRGNSKKFDLNIKKTY